MVVTDVKLGGKTISAGQFNHGAAGAVLEVQPDANSIAIEFSALDYVDAARDQYAYRLVGFDKDWIETDPSRRVAAYDNLPPGSYILRARVLGPSGRPAGAVLEVPIRVLPAWYQTPVVPRRRRVAVHRRDHAGAAHADDAAPADVSASWSSWSRGGRRNSANRTRP